MYCGQVGARREKVAKASTTLWKLIDGGADSNDEDDKVPLRYFHGFT